MVAERAPRLAGESGLSGMGAVVGATEPAYLARLRELMPDSVFLVPGVGAQGGSPDDLGPAFSGAPGVGRSSPPRGRSRGPRIPPRRPPSCAIGSGRFRKAPPAERAHRLAVGR